MKPARLPALLVDFVYPPICAACQGLLPSDAATPVCPTCWDILERDTGPDTPPPEKEYVFTRIRALYAFSERFQTLIHLLKYGDKPSVGRELGKRMAGLVPAEFFSSVNLVVSVPVHHTRKRERGYNQAEVIAAELAKALSVSMDPKALTRLRKTGTQTKLGKGGRRGNIESAFKAGRKFDGLCVLLVDDVYTTGATVNECAKVLMEAGAAEVRVVTAGRA